MQTGYNHARELAARKDSDHIFGALSQPAVVSIPLEERETYLPQGELQNIGEEKYDCASRSPVNHCEALMTYHYQHNMQPENKKWLQDNGYTVYDKVVLSDVFVSINSGTTKEGNSLIEPLHAIHDKGMIPKWMLPQLNGWDENADPARITGPMKDLGAEFARRFLFKYERVPEILIAEDLKDDMVGVAAFAWPPEVNGIYPRTEGDPNHAFLLYKPQYFAFDNYLSGEGTFTKHLAPDYDFFEFGYRLYLTKEDANATPKLIGLYQQLLNLLQRIREIITGKV